MHCLNLFTSRCRQRRAENHSATGIGAARNGVVLQSRWASHRPQRTRLRILSAALVALITVLGANSLALANDDAVCLARLQAEQLRIEREMVAQRPDRSNQEALERWSRKLHAALTAAGKEAEACSLRNRVPLSADARGRLDNCVKRASERIAEVDLRYRGRNLTREEQGQLRTEQQSVLDERMACEQAEQRKR